MPELPEVEIARRNLARWTRSHRIVDAEAEKTRTFRGADPAAFRTLRGKVKSVERKGKYLMVALEKGQGFLAHLGMTGKLVRRPRGVAELYSRARLVLDNGQVIHFRDPRMFGRVEPMPADQLWSNPVIAGLGRDPLTEGLTPAQLRESVGRTRQPLKVALMDQSLIAGLGNIHAAEALFRAKLHPARLPASLTAAEWAHLTKAINASIAFGIETQRGEEIDYVEEPGTENPFLIYGRAKERCSVCRSVVKSFVQGGRTTHYCPRCQPKRGTSR